MAVRLLMGRRRLRGWVARWGRVRTARVPSVHLGGLSPGTEYHYRVVAVSEVEVTPGVVEVHDFLGADEVFTTQGPAASWLPDGRTYEMVSPPVKDGALIESIDCGVGRKGR